MFTHGEKAAWKKKAAGSSTCPKAVRTSREGEPELEFAIDYLKKNKL